MTMRRSPRRPLILRRRKLPFQQNDPPAAEPPTQPAASTPKEPPKPDAGQSIPDGIRIMNHPTMSDMQLVVVPKTADLQSIIGALTAKGKESGAQGPNKFILLSENSSRDGGSACPAAAEGQGVSAGGSAGPAVKEENMNSQDVKPLTAINKFRDLEEGPLDDSLTNIHWLGKVSTCTLTPEAAKKMVIKEDQDLNSETPQTNQPQSERPPYSYMAMIQFAINSRKNRRMTLKEIYNWVEDHFPYFREVAKPGWKNSIRHNLSLHDLFIRETSPDGKISYWTIRPEANRCLTLDQVYRPGCDPKTAAVPLPMLLLPNQQQRRILSDARKTPAAPERRMKPLLPRTESYLIPIQLPVTSSVYLPPSQPQFPSSTLQQKQIVPRGAKRVRIAPKVTQSDAPAAPMLPQKQSKNKDVQVKEEPVSVPIMCTTPKSSLKRPASSSRRKQCLVHSLNEEPLLLSPENTFFDSGVVCDASTFQDVREIELEEQQQQSPLHELSFKTPIKSSSHLTSSTPSRPPCSAAPEPWKVTPVGKGSNNVLDCSPIRTPGGPTMTPLREYNTFSFNSTPFKEWPVFSSPRELLTFAPSRATPSTDSPISCLRSSCSRELLQAGGASTPLNRSVTEGLVLDTMNDSLSKILVDISFSCLEDEDMGLANISWSEFLPQLN